jgi:DNA-binding MarR family transcriptional regulator
VNELPDADHRLTAIVTDLARIFHSTPQRVPPPLVRDLTLGQLGLLFRLQRNGPMTMGDIAEVFDISSTASSGFVSRVERHGLVERRHSSTDRRIVECRLTEAGERLVGEISGVRSDAMRRAIGTLDGPELTTFGSLVATIRERLERTEQPA